MDILRRSLLGFTLTLALISLKAQDTKAISEVFSSSYTYEYDGNYAEAIKVLKDIYDPDSYHINARLGWLSYLSGQFTESAAFYQKAIELKPYAIEARFGLINPASAMGNWGQVKSQYIYILNVDPQNVKANYYFGLMYYETKDYAQAAMQFERVINLYPFDSASLLMYAWSNFQLGKTREAEVLFNEVLIINPGNASALEGLELIK